MTQNQNKTTGGEDERFYSFVSHITTDDNLDPYQKANSFRAALDHRDAKRDQLIEARAREAVLESLQYKLEKHFTSWGGVQGNCLPEDIIHDLIVEEQSKIKELEGEND